MAKLRRIVHALSSSPLRLLFLLFFTSVVTANARHVTRRHRQPPWYETVQWQIRGSYKSILGHQRFRDEGIFSRSNATQLEERLRLTGSFSKDWLRLEFADEMSLFAQQANAQTIPTPQFTPSPWWNTRHYIINETGFRVSNYLERAYAQVSVGRFDMTVGKQVVGIGVGTLFTAVSQTPRDPFVIIDSEYPITEDAISIFWNGLWTIGVRFFPKTPDSTKPNYQLRTEGNRGDFDVGFTLGQSHDKPYLGVETAGNLGDSVIRAELVGYEDEGEAVLQSLVGFDRVFSPTFKGMWEVFYNGFGVNDPSLYQWGTRRHRSAPYQGRWYAGMRFQWEITPLLKFTLSTIANLRDPSGLLHGLLSYSISDNMELLLGQYVNVSSIQGGEFGGRFGVVGPLKLGLPDLTYTVLRWYF